MAVINSYYLYQKYEKRGNQPWIPCYPNTWSVDADGTMPPVLKQQDDPSCYHPIYRWVQTQDTICIDTTTIEYRTTSGTPYCDGYDKYVDTTYEQSFDGGVTWEFVSSSSTLVETDSEYCGYEPTPEVQYRWTESGTTCDNANKYKRYIKEVSYDGGEAWLVVQPPQYSAGTLVESDSYDCGYRTSATTSATYCSNANQYVDVYSLVSRDYGVTWSTASTSTELIEEDVVECGFSARTISTATTCVGVDKHYLDEYQESRDTGTTWTTISSSTGSLIESQSTDCGYVPPTPTQYRWTQSGTTCIGYDKYQNNIKEQSTDGGETWTVVIPEEYSASTLIESQSTDCGYVPTPTIDGKFQATYLDSSTFSAECDSTSAVTGEDIGNTYARTPNIINITIGDCVTSIGDSTFWNCSTLTSVSISNSVTTIGQGAFLGCTALGSIVMPNSVISVGGRTFGNCYSLSSVTISNNLTSISSQMFQYTVLRSVNIPSSVTSIGDSAFNGCTGFTSVIIPSSVTSIGTWAFSDNVNLTSVTIGSGVTTIAGAAFQNCTSMTSITCLATTPPSLWYLNDQMVVFDNTNNCPIYVPSRSVDAYKSAMGWGHYASRIQAIT